MKNVVNDSALGRIEFEESFWTGKRAITINGKPLIKKSNKLFEYNDGEAIKTVKVKGNTFTGAGIEVDGVSIEVFRKLKWYEIVLAVVLVVFVMSWGNSYALCSIIPAVGGGLGGVISALGACTYLLLTKKEMPVWKRLLIWAGCFVGTFLTCVLLAFVLLGVMA